MDIEILRSTLGWCTVINFGLLIWWALFILLAHDLVYRLHSRWFKLSVEQFDVIHYTGMAFFKIMVLLFNLAPYIALRIVT